MLATLPGPPDLVVVDGYAMLGPDRPGLGAHLHDALGGSIPVVGVAKTAFAGAVAIPVLRGSSAVPLWITAIGIDPAQAAGHVTAMHGPHRLPTLLVRADHLARGLAQPGSRPADRARNVKTRAPSVARVVPPATTMSAPAARVLHVLGHVQRNLDGDLSLRALARAARRDRFELHRAFRRVAGETTKQYTNRLRLDRAAAELLAGDRTILEIALACGFASHEVFTRAFQRRFGVSPRVYRRRGLTGPGAPGAGGSPAGADLAGAEPTSASLAVRHAAVVRAAAPCIGLYHMSSREMRRTEMSETVTVNRRDLASQPALVIRRSIKQAEIALTLGEVLPRVFQHAQKAGIAMVGPPFVRYLSVGRGLLTIEAGMPVAAAGGSEGEIEAIELPGGPAAVAIHAGPYDRLEDTYAAIESWISSSGERAAGAPWEVYLTDPADHPDPAEWRTEVLWPLER